MHTKRDLKYATRRLVCTLMMLTTAFSGCRSTPDNISFDREPEFQSVGTQIEYTDACIQPAAAIAETMRPHTLTESDLAEFEYWELTLDEVVRTALSNSKIMRDLGARVLNTPTVVPTVFDPSLVQTNPRGGEEAALSAFDAQFATSLFFNRTERTFNSALQRGDIDGVFQLGSFTANTAAFQSEISKTAATGTQFAMRNRTDYTRDSNASNTLSSVYDTVFEAEFRHPLLKGGGLTFNRIAGPNGGPGFYNGIVIARINTDIALADFEASVRQFIDEIQRTYWQLYFAYRNLASQRDGRAAALESWRTSRVQFETGAGDGLNEALAQQQFFDFEARVKNALSGSGTATGIFTVERQLRVLMGVSINDGRLIRPAQEPTRAETLFDFHESLFQAMDRRVELRRQRWNVKSKELQLLAAKNLVRMQLDLVGQYRWRGFGDDLLGNGGTENGSAARDLFTGDLQGWAMGLELSTPIGNRIGHVSVRNAEISLARDRAILREQEKYITKDLSDALSEIDRALHLTKTRYNQFNAAKRRLELTEVQYDAGNLRFEFVLSAQSQLSDSQSAFFQALVDYNLAIAQVHYARGSFLDYMGVALSEGAWCANAYSSARKEHRRFAQREMNYCYTVPSPISRGAYNQSVLPRNSASQFDGAMTEGSVMERSMNDSPVPTAADPNDDESFRNGSRFEDAYDSNGPVEVESPLDRQMNDDVIQPEIFSPEQPPEPSFIDRPFDSSSR